MKSNLVITASFVLTMLVCLAFSRLQTTPAIVQQSDIFMIEDSQVPLGIYDQDPITETDDLGRVTKQISKCSDYIEVQTFEYDELGRISKQCTTRTSHKGAKLYEQNSVYSYSNDGSYYVSSHIIPKSSRRKFL